MKKTTPTLFHKNQKRGEGGVSARQFKHGIAPLLELISV